MTAYDDWKTTDRYIENEPTSVLVICDACEQEFDHTPEYDADEDGAFELPPPDMCGDCEANLLKVCACGRRYTIESWARLRFSHYWHAELWDGDGIIRDHAFESRHCECRSTLTIEVE